jgi:hypothetical protein
MYHNVVLSIVIVELVIAFSVGVMCIIFSFNLLRVIKDSANANLTMTTGDFPPSHSSNLRSISESDYSAIPDEELRRVRSESSELDFETQLEPDSESGTWGMLHTFGGYLRLW